MKIGVFGGSFNPIHNGHIALAETFLKKASLDEVWMLVSPQNPFKMQQTLLEDNKRFILAKKALLTHPHIVASNYEFSLQKPSYTWDTLQHLTISYPNHTFNLLIGGDNWKSFNKWKNSEEILSHFRIYIYPRKEDYIDATNLPQNVCLLQAPLLDISSTMIRERIRIGAPIDHLVPQNIIQDIESYYK